MRIEFICEALSNITASGGGSSAPAGNTTTTQTTTPWAGQQPYLNDVFQSAANLYYGTGGPQYYQGNTVAQPGSATQAAQAAELNYGNNVSPLYGSATGGLNTIVGQGFLNSTPGQDTFQSIANGGGTNPATGLAAAQAVSTPGSGVLSSLASNPNLSGAAGLVPFADGSMLNDPYLKQAMDATNNQITNNYQTAIAPGIASSAESAGRYGSGAAINAQGQGQLQLGNALANADTNLLNNNYQTQTGNMLNASTALQNAILGQQGMQAGAANSLAQNSLAATGLLGQIGNYNVGNALTAASGLGSDYNNAASNSLKGDLVAPSIAQMPLSNIAALSDVGSQQDALNQANINANIQKWNYNQLLPYQNLQTFDQFINGNYGGQTVTQQPYFANKGASGLGGALGGAASGAMIGSMFGPWGTAIGGVGGGLLGAFSDETLKEHIADARDFTDDLMKVHVVEYSYKAENADKPTQVGVLAQEIEEVFPEMVFEAPFDGETKKAVSYGAFIPMIIKAMQGLVEENRIMKSRLAALEV